MYNILYLPRYTILQAGPVANAGTKDLKEISKVICKGSIDGERYRIGHSKIFFRAGNICYISVTDIHYSNSFCFSMKAISFPSSSRVEHF